MSIVAASTLSNQASPQQADDAPSPDLPSVDGFAQTRAFDDIMLVGQAVANLTGDVLSHPHTVTDPTIGSAEQHVISPIDNAALAALNAAGETGQPGETAVGTVTGGNAYPVARSMVPP